MVEQGNQADAVVLHRPPQRLVVRRIALELVRVGQPDHAGVVRLRDAVEEPVDLQPLLVQAEDVEGNPQILSIVTTSQKSLPDCRAEFGPLVSCPVLDAVAARIVPLVTITTSTR